MTRANSIMQVHCLDARKARRYPRRRSLRLVCQKCPRGRSAGRLRSAEWEPFASEPSSRCRSATAQGLRRENQVVRMASRKSSQNRTLRQVAWAGQIETFHLPVASTRPTFSLARPQIPIDQPEKGGCRACRIRLQVPCTSVTLVAIHFSLPSSNGLAVPDANPRSQSTRPHQGYIA